MSAVRTTLTDQLYECEKVNRELRGAIERIGFLMELPPLADESDVVDAVRRLLSARVTTAGGSNGVGNRLFENGYRVAALAVEERVGFLKEDMKYAAPEVLPSVVDRHLDALVALLEGR